MRVAPTYLAHCGHQANSLVTRNQRKLGDEFAFMNVLENRLESVESSPFMVGDLVTRSVNDVSFILDENPYTYQCHKPHKL